MTSHPIEEFMEESKISYGPIHVNQFLDNKKCTLLTNGISPVSSLTSNQIKLATTYIQSKGYHLEINGETAESGWVVGVENEQFYQSAVSGKSISLIPTGFGENLFKKLFPGGEILKLPA